MAAVLVINGPNLNMLGVREPQIYGTETLAAIEARCRARAQTLGHSVTCRQSNYEGEIVTWIQESRGNADGIILNAGALTHSSIAIHDALRATGLPVIEVHLSNIFKRETFRHHSYVSPQAEGMICGFGSLGYELALDAMSHLLATAKKG